MQIVNRNGPLSQICRQLLVSSASRLLTLSCNGVDSCARFVAVLAPAVHSTQADIVFDTSQSPINPGQNSQGYDQLTEARVINSNYFVGQIDGGNVGIWRNFFTFDLTDLSPTDEIVSATLQLRRYSTATGPGDVNYQLLGRFHGRSHT